ncbi:hypothetical protein TNCV_700751 [Trichonephila clavipes]|nr:hypothetical protein TNCV_700751 [Trichonephila clavipes]
MPKKKCALRKGVTKWPILQQSVANWVLENRLNGLIVTRNSVRLFALKWSKKDALSCYPTMKVHKKCVGFRFTEECKKCRNQQAILLRNFFKKLRSSKKHRTCSRRRLKDEIGNSIEEVANLARQINLEVDSDDV